MRSILHSLSRLILIFVFGSIPNFGALAQTVDIRVSSAAISGNALKDPSEITVVVYLPQAYFQNPEQKFPVVYWLGGFDTRARQLLRWQIELDEAMGTDGNTPFILVEPDGYNQFQGSLFMSSPTIGNWQDFVVNELVGAIDTQFRTIPQKESRGLAGFYTGGYAALEIGLKHPDVFSSIWAFSPSIFAEQGLEEAFNNNWSYSFKRAYASAFSPTPTKPFFQIPKFDKSREDNEVVAQWRAGFGNMEQKLADWAPRGKPTKIGLWAEEHSAYPWLVEGCKNLNKTLSKYGYDSLLEIDLRATNGHEVSVPAGAATRLVGFFSPISPQGRRETQR